MESMSSKDSAETAAEHNLENTLENSEMDRRRFLATTAAVGVAAATAGTGVASAQSEGVNFDGELAHDPRATATATIEDVYLSGTEDLSNMGDLDFVDNSGTVQNLADWGITTQGVEEIDVEERVAADCNPIEIRADKATTEAYTAWPRGETVADGDGGEEDLGALTHPSEWTTSANATVEADGDALRFSTSGLSTGSEETARFDAFETITSGVMRKYVQMVLDVVSVPSDGTVEFRVFSEDSAVDPWVVSIDPAAEDATADDVIATSSATGLVAQPRIGDLDVDLESISAFEIAAVDADSELLLHGLDLERESRWSFGESTTSVDEDGNAETETLREFSGWTGLTSLSTLSETILGGATISDVRQHVETRASLLPGSETFTEVTEAPAGIDYERRLRVAHIFYLPTAFELNWSTNALSDEGTLSSSRYNEVGVATEVGTVTGWEDIDELSLTDRTSSYGFEQDVELLPVFDPGQGNMVVYDLGMSADEVDSYLGGSSGGWALVGSSGGSGGDGALNVARSAWMSLIALVGGGIAYATGLLGKIGSKFGGN